MPVLGLLRTGGVAACAAMRGKDAFGAGQGEDAGASPDPGPARRASAPCCLQPRADGVAAHHGVGVTTVPGARDSAACANASSIPVQPPATPASVVNDERMQTGAGARTPTPRTPTTQRRGRRSPAGAISGAPRSTGLAASAQRYRHHSRRGCLSAESEANAASSATGRKTEHRRAVGAFSARPPQHEPPPGSACRDARQRQRNCIRQRQRQRQTQTVRPQTPLFGLTRNLAPVACLPYTATASSCNASANDTSCV